MAISARVGVVSIVQQARPGRERQAGTAGCLLLAAWWAAGQTPSQDVEQVMDRAFGATVCDPDDPEVEDLAQAALLRDMICNPFRARPAIPAGVLAFNDGCVVKLASRI